MGQRKAKLDLDLDTELLCTGLTRRKGRKLRQFYNKVEREKKLAM